VAALLAAPDLGDEMKRFLGLAITMALGLFFPVLSAAGQRHAALRAQRFSIRTFSHARFFPGVPAYPYGYPVSPYNYPSQFFYWPNYPSLVVISSYAQPYYYYPTAVVVASAPYICALHNQGFMSRVGLLDHLSGMHGVPLDTASAICPDGAAACYFPLH